MRAFDKENGPKRLRVLKKACMRRKGLPLGRMHAPPLRHFAVADGEVAL